MASARSVSVAPAASSATSATRGTSGGAGLWAAAFVLFALSTAVAFLQPLRPDPLTPARSMDWWLHPVERNGFRRLHRLTQPLHDVCTVRRSGKPTLIWACGGGGLVVHSPDGGETWVTQSTPTRATLRGISMIDERGGWAVGDDRTALQTLDGGDTWTHGTIRLPPAEEQKRFQPAPRPQEFTDIAFADATRGALRVQGLYGTEFFETPDGGETWVARFEVDEDVPTPMCRASGEVRYWSGGVVRAIVDSGTQAQPVTWKAPSSLEAGRVAAFTMDAGDLGWVVLTDGRLVGLRWNSEFSRELQAPASAELAVVDDDTLVVVGNGIHFVSTASALVTDLATGGGQYARLWFGDRDTGWFAAGGDVVLATQDGGGVWEPALLPLRRAQGEQRAQQRPPDEPVFDEAVGAVLPSESVDGGLGTRISAAWRLSAPEHVRERAAVAVTPERAYAVGDDGTLVRVTPTQAGPAVQIATEGQVLSDIDFVDADHGWVAGSGATILRTTDGGATWHDPVLPWRRYPAPWYWIACTASLGLCVVALRRKPHAARAPDSIADTLSSDRPLTAGDPDAMNLAEIAAGVSRFFRNENTQPPLTVAISGEWGTGKSSLMNLIRADLKSKGARPVWFNAWHHQSEKQLLPALLDQVRRAVVPPWWHSGAWVFRMNLLRIRGLEHLAPLFLVIAVLALSLGLIVGSDPERRLDLFASIASFGDWLKGLVTGDASASTGAETTERIGVITFLAGAAALARGAWSAFSAFGIQPAVLLASVARGAKPGETRANVSFRETFAKQFGEVTRALGGQRLVIFIDDLDRCRPEHVLEVLETVNFLVSTGECFVVMGMARDQVTAAVGLGFKEVAQEMVRIEPPREGAAPSKDDREEAGRQRRATFARQYLEKLVNMEIPVPPPTRDQSRAMLSGLGRSREELTPSLLRRLRRRIVPFWPVAALVSIAGAAFAIGFGWPDTREVESGRAFPASAPALRTATTVPDPGTDMVSPGDLRTGSVAPPPKTPAGALLPGDSLRSSTAVFLLLAPCAGFLLAAGWWVLTRRPDLVVKDSPQFADALLVWHDVIALQHPTPRAIKRFKNRLRYLAMRQRVSTPPPPLWETLRRQVRRWLRRPDAAAVPPSAAGVVPEATLVALAALEGLVTEDSGVLAARRDAEEEHEKALGKLDVTQHRAAFARLAQGLRMN